MKHCLMFVLLLCLNAQVDAQLLGEECQEGQNYMMGTNTQPVCTNDTDCVPYGTDTFCIPQLNGKCLCSKDDGFALNQTTNLCSIQINECTCGYAECQHECVDLDPSNPDNLGITYKCLCNEGFFLFNRHHCNDTDECAIPDFCGPAADCVNTNGSFNCTCHEGWEQNPENGTCMDIDECAIGADNCEQKCDNNPGSFSCSCNTGYSVDPTNSTACQDVDECLPNAGVDACGSFVDNCTNSNGSFFCYCQNGYEGGANTSCSDIDECVSDPSVCQYGGACSNSQGSFSCSCENGFQNGAAYQLCEDIDECQTAPGQQSICGPDAYFDFCENSIGSWSCNCSVGYEGGEKTPCTNVNECDVNPNICINGTCSDTDGNFSCSCQKGYETAGIGQPCLNKNECLSSPCGPNGTGCSDMTPGFQCTCQTGYSAEFFETCEDVNECDLDGEYCGNSSIAVGCENMNGTFNCSCQEGYTGGVGVLCQDHDECQVPGFCGYGGQCSNLVGNFNCSCPYPAFMGGVGTRCYDNDECEEIGTDICGSLGTYGECINSIGGFHCNCTEGYYTDLMSEPCQDVDECSEIPLEDLCGNYSIDCANVNGSYQCLCQEGYNASESETCSDVEECDYISCEGLGTCMNVEGSFYCDCIVGYMTNYSTGFCDDYDECEVVDCGDDVRATCVNTEGSYTCDCGNEGRWLGPGFKCQYERTFVAQVRVLELWSDELLDENSESYAYVTGNVIKQIEDAVARSPRLRGKLLSISVLTIVKTDFIVYLNLTFANVVSGSKRARRQGDDLALLSDQEILDELANHIQPQPGDIQVDSQSLGIASFASGSVENGDADADDDDEDGLHGMFDKSEVDLTCHWDGMEVMIPTKPNANMSNVELSLLDSDCVFEEYGNGLYYHIYFKYFNCSSLKTTTNDSIVFTQYVLMNDSMDPIDQSDGSMLSVAHSSILATLRCEYFRESVLMNSVLTDNDPVMVTQSGTFKVDLLMYTDATYTQEHSSYPVGVSLGEQLYFAAALTSTDPNLRLSLHSCWITPNNNLYNPMRNYISQDFCPVSDDFEYMTGLRRDYFVPFSYKAQVIIANDGSMLDSVYYICQYDLCDLTPGDSMEVCQDETNSCSNSRRQRRSLRSSSSGRLTSDNVISGMLSVAITLTGLDNPSLLPDGQEIIRITTPAADPKGPSESPTDDRNTLNNNDVTILQKSGGSSTAAIAALAATVGFLVAVIAGLYFCKMRAKTAAGS